MIIITKTDIDNVLYYYLNLNIHLLLYSLVQYLVYPPSASTTARHLLILVIRRRIRCWSIIAAQSLGKMRRNPSKIVVALMRSLIANLRYMYIPKDVLWLKSGLFEAKGEGALMRLLIANLRCAQRCSVPKDVLGPMVKIRTF